MAINDQMVHVGDYPLMQQDTEDKFHGKHLLYLHWENHPMFAAPFCIPVPRTLPFGAVIMEVLPELYGEHPDFAQIDWSRVQWFRGDVMFTPRADGTLASHGFGHKSVLRFRTPGLEGLRGSCG